MKKQSPYGAWKNVDYTLQQARTFMQQHNFTAMPGTNVLNNLGYCSLAHAIYKYHGGTQAFRGLLEQQEPSAKPPLQAKPRRPNGYWIDRKNVEKELERIMNEHNLDHIPSMYELTNLGESPVGCAIVAHHGGMRSFREQAGDAPRARPVGVWKDLSYTIQQARQVMSEQKCDILPGARKLQELGYSSLSRAVVLHHGGWRKFRTVLGEKQLRRENGAWKEQEEVIAEANRLKQEHGWTELPGADTLCRMGYTSFVTGVHRNHGGLTKLRELLGDEPIRGIPEEFKNLEYLLGKAREIMASSKNGKLPGTHVLQKEHYHLYVAATNYHGGISRIRDLLGTPRTAKPP